MVKNEEKTLPRLIQSVDGFADKIIALDTGSTDNTKWILKSAGADILEIPFHDFGRSRTQLMKFAKRQADWLLLMDADQTLVAEAGDKFREQLPFTSPDITAFSLKHRGTHPYWVPRLVRGDRDWNFVGSTHEYLAQSHTAVKLPGIEIEHHADGGSRFDKFERDYRLLKQEIADDPTNERAVFYLANTCRDMGRLHEAKEYYYQRAAMGGWAEEVFMAKLEAARITLDPLELWETWAARPTRAEPLYILESVYRGRGEDTYAFQVEALRSKIPVPEEDVLWVDKAAYAPIAAAPIVPWQSIPGWWYGSEEQFYKRLIALIPDNGKFTEIGSWMGRSFACFDYWAKERGKRIFKTAVDTFRGTPTEPNEADIARQFPDGYKQEFIANMVRCGVSGYQILDMSSLVAVGHTLAESQDAVFFDGDHSTEGLSADLEAWIPAIRPGGYACGHDFDRASVQAAVFKFFKANKVKVFGRCWIAQNSWDSLV